MVKKILTVVLFFAACYSVSAQRYYREGERGRDREAYEDDQTYGDGFKTEHLFIGGNLGLGYDSYTFSAGISPEVGYSFARWFDAGVLVNLNYSSERADPYYNDNTRLRSFNYGIGAFARAYPLPFLFLQAGPEMNWIHYSYKSFSGGTSGSYDTQAASLLLGVGYGQRLVGKSSMHLALLVDVLNNKDSPYLDSYGRIIPVLKAGFDIYFHPKRK